MFFLIFLTNNKTNLGLFYHTFASLKITDL